MATTPFHIAEEKKKKKTTYKIHNNFDWLFNLFIRCCFLFLVQSQFHSSHWVWCVAIMCNKKNEVQSYTCTWIIIKNKEKYIQEKSTHCIKAICKLNRKQFDAKSSVEDKEYIWIHPQLHKTNTKWKNKIDIEIHIVPICKSAC